MRNRKEHYENITHWNGTVSGIAKGPTIQVPPSSSFSRSIQAALTEQACGQRLERYEIGQGKRETWIEVFEAEIRKTIIISHSFRWPSGRERVRKIKKRRCHLSSSINDPQAAQCTAFAWSFVIAVTADVPILASRYLTKVFRLVSP